ncbi:MAG: PmeII family type II restriction endonuclease [Termitinemataceae bacterium]|nr:MAG: PmeII family type II restriction endonuclease [Termitinemataceae bacterium]
MKPLLISDVVQYVEQNIAVFHEQRLHKLDALKLHDVLKKKNPYLFKAKYVLTADEIVKQLADAYISSSEEGIFGDWLEGLAIFINSKVYGGWKSATKGIDLEFDKDNVRNIITIKSGPNWGNSSQLEKMKADFNTAKKTLRTSNSNLQIVCINGCCYGKDNNPDKGAYFKYCGQRFWEFIGGNENIYTDIVEPLGNKAKERNDDFKEKYAAMLNRFTKEFIETFCAANGSINWKQLVEFNSGKN